MFNSVDCLQTSVVGWPDATLNIVGLPLKENTGMSKLLRGSMVFAGLVVVVLGVSQVIFATQQSQDPAASSSETSKAAKSQTKSKKTKKKKAANNSFIVLGTYAPQTVALP